MWGGLLASIAGSIIVYFKVASIVLKELFERRRNSICKYNIIRSLITFIICLIVIFIGDVHTLSLVCGIVIIYMYAFFNILAVVDDVKVFKELPGNKKITVVLSLTGAISLLIISFLFDIVISLVVLLVFSLIYLIQYRVSVKKIKGI